MFISVDFFRHACSVVGAIWTPPTGYVFDGDDRIDCGVGASIISLQQGCVEVWARNNGDSYGDLFSIGDKDSSLYNILYVQADATVSKRQLNILLKSQGTTQYAFITQTGTSYYGNTWNHVVFGSDGSTNYAWINASPQTLTATAGSNNGSWFGDIVNVDNFTIGSEIRSLTPVNNLNGGIGEMRIYNRLLTTAEVLYNYGKTMLRYQ